MNKKRVQEANSIAYTKGSILVALGRDYRAYDNDAILYGIECAKAHKVPLIVSVCIWPKHVGATHRFYDVHIRGLMEMEKTLRVYNIPMMIVYGKEHEALLPYIKNNDIGMLITDILPLRFAKSSKKILIETIDIPFHIIDAHNVIPAHILSEKQEWAAHTIRRKVYAHLPFFLEDYDMLSKITSHALDVYTAIDWNSVWKEIKERKYMREDILPVSDFTGGEKEARKVLRHFLENKIIAYDEMRNHINVDGQSNLSPYITHGHISRRRIVQEVIAHTGVAIEKLFKEKDEDKNKDKKMPTTDLVSNAAVFLEELVVRAELAENFCTYNPIYDRVEGFPKWAEATLAKASTDTRQYIYTKKQFEKGETHDALWNAAQMQMIQTGKMHGYMRMYWAKKILEWSATAEDALATAIYLNDSYQLDGRDPNGYVGCAWSIGGVHDRAWFPRPIFGTIRYMAESGVAKRGKVKDYIHIWTKK